MLIVHQNINLTQLCVKSQVNKNNPQSISELKNEIIPVNDIKHLNKTVDIYGVPKERPLFVYKYHDCNFNYQKKLKSQQIVGFIIDLKNSLI